MGSTLILSVKEPVTITTMLNFDGLNFGVGTCEQGLKHGFGPYHKRLITVTCSENPCSQNELAKCQQYLNCFPGQQKSQLLIMQPRVTWYKSTFFRNKIDVNKKRPLCQKKTAPNYPLSYVTFGSSTKHFVPWWCSSTTMIWFEKSFSVRLRFCDE